MTNAKGADIELSPVGAGIVSIVVPDKDGKLGDVMLGYDKAELYFADGPFSITCSENVLSYIGSISSG